MSPHGGGPVGATGGVFVEGAGPPDMLARAMDLGVIDGRDPVAMPEPPRLFVDELRQRAGEEVGLPEGVLGEGLDGLPVVDPLDGGDGLGDGVLLDIEGKCGDPLDEAAMTGASEGGGKRLE